MRAIDADELKEQIRNGLGIKSFKYLLPAERYIVDKIDRMPTIQPEQNLDEWCTDCKEYDADRHCCPRWNRVIRQTIADAQPQRTGKWIPKDGRYYCDQCSGIAPRGIRWDFCPHCGVKMGE